jgi:SAM-dependent methyltransferase
MMGHSRFVAIAGIIVSILILILIPSLKWLSGLLMALVLLHLAMILLLAFSTFIILPDKTKRRIATFLGKKRNVNEFEYGWSQTWLNAYWVAGTLLLLFSILCWFYFPAIHLLAFVTFIVSVLFYMGSSVIRSSKNTNQLTLPYVRFFGSDTSNILDAGCGAGRTTISLGRIYDGNIVAFDRFDSDYIEGGGNSNLARNIELAGIADRVKIIQGDITQTNFSNNYFDAAISTFMIDHLGDQKLPSLKEINRVLKPGCKLLMIVIVPNLTSFAIANIFCLFLTSKKQWRKYFTLSGYNLAEEGDINGAAYFLVEKNLN